MSEKKFSYRIFKHGRDILLAISDISILGKTFREGELEININEEFYSDKFADENEIIEKIRNVTIVNAIGNEIIELMLKERMIAEDCIFRIQGVSHAQIISIE